jgi:hypothetical protein
MALVTSLLFQGVRGRFGNVVFKQRRGKTYIEPIPVYNKDRIPTQKEMRVREDFAMAVSYARKVLTTPELREIYKKKAYRKKTVFGIAFRHALKEPVVIGINTEKYKGSPRSKIFVRVKDDVMVTEVRVIIITGDGVIVEEGNARLLSKQADWTYIAKKQNWEMEKCRVIAVAKNLPGNEGGLEKALVSSRKERLDLVQA